MANESVTVDRLPKHRVACTVKVDEATFGPAEAQALQAFSDQIEIKGFRKGFAPADMVRARVPADQLFEEAVRIVLRGLLPSLVEENKIIPVVPPKVEIVSKLPVTIKITFIERPDVTVKDPDSFVPKKKEVQADPKDVQRVIDSVMHEHRIVADAGDKASAEQDQVTIDFWAADEAGAEIAGLRATGYSAIIGSKTLLPGFEDALKGMKKGENKSFTLNLPGQFQVEALRNKPATFHVTVHKVEEVSLPELTDAFAKEKLQAETAAAFREMVETSVRSQEEQFARMERERVLMDEIRNNTKVELADELIEEEMRAMIEDWARRLESQGKTIEDALKEKNQKVEDVEKDMRAQAEDRWKLRLGIAKLIEIKKIEVSDEELNAAFARFSQNLPGDQKAGAADEWNKRGNLFEEVRWRTMVDKLVEGLLG